MHAENARRRWPDPLSSRHHGGAPIQCAGDRGNLGDWTLDSADGCNLAPSHVSVEDVDQLGRLFAESAPQLIGTFIDLFGGVPVEGDDGQ